MFRLASLRIASARVLATRPTAVRRTVMPALALRWYSAGNGLHHSVVLDQIFQVLHDFDKIHKENISSGADFSIALGLDSLDTLKLIMAIEAFSVEIPDEDAMRITTVAATINYIQGRDDAR
ncbi:mitochondrial acyl carrier protein [Coemansia pectinata]|uniref:Acyl carrier protein n=1 Tax=Coemansia pectinata TaxID=1052879 RepID=A0A9W8LBG9_9FUNG|nr:mitochondrial acyl carrier protein [Coemansia pectinata]